MVQKGIPAPLVKRLNTKRCLWLLRMNDRTINSMHEAGLLGTYNFEAQNLDIVEIAALHAAIPAVFTVDPTGKKKAWRQNLVKTLRNMMTLKENGTLRKDLLRHPAYKVFMYTTTSNTTTAINTTILKPYHYNTVKLLLLFYYYYYYYYCQDADSMLFQGRDTLFAYSIGNVATIDGGDGNGDGGNGDGGDDIMSDVIQSRKMSLEHQQQQHQQQGDQHQPDQHHPKQNSDDSTAAAAAVSVCAGGTARAPGTGNIIGSLEEPAGAGRVMSNSSSRSSSSRSGSTGDFSSMHSALSGIISRGGGGNTTTSTTTTATATTITTTASTTTTATATTTASTSASSVP
jgi:hypothetical protein